MGIGTNEMTWFVAENSEVMVLDIPGGRVDGLWLATGRRGIN